MGGAVDVAVLSPVAGLIVRALRSSASGAAVDPVAVHADEPVPSPVADVALVSTYWPVHVGRDFDLLDAVAWLADRSDAPVLVLGRGSVDAAFIDEALGHPQVVGVVRADIEPEELTAALVAVADRRPHPAVVDVAPAGPTLAEALADNRLMATVACAIAVGGATTWSDIARASGFSIRTVQTAPRRFAPLVRADLDLPAGHDVTQPLLYHWLGTKSAYLRSWCRRHPACAGGRA
ncbi:hypothetical protein [Euzebya sp.]|uniref:hypothetical protein n=1 Tax=Euzebya sp. TaxID=1971409 RepID=UPI003510DCE9